MKRFALVLALVGLASGLLLACPPIDRTPGKDRLQVEEAVPAFKLVTVHAPEGIDPKAALIWKISPSDKVSKSEYAPENVFQFTAPPGKYRIELTVISQDAAGKLSAKVYETDVEIAPCPGQVPPMPAPPPPDKGPPPAPPSAGKLDPPKAIAKISFPPYGCTATVIGPRRSDGKWDVLTANHCIAHVGVGATGKMTMLDGRQFTVKVQVRDPKCDVSWLTVEDAAVSDMPYANLAADNPAPGTKIWHAGYGVDRPGNREDGEVVAGEDANGQLKMQLSVSSGDSGGGILRADTNEVISCVCCTARKGAKVSMWGGSVAQARRLRPKGTVAEAEWKPVELPLVEVIGP